MKFIIKKKDHRCTNMTVLKRNFFRTIAAKKLPAAVSKGAKRIGQFALQQMKHPAVAQFARDQAGSLAASGFNPEAAAPAMAARTAQEGSDVIQGTACHFAC